MDCGRSFSPSRRYSSLSRRHHRQRQKRRESCRDAHRPGAGTAAAVRRGERLVQIDVDRVEAHVARLDLAENGIEVGAVVIQQPAGVVHDFLDVEDVLLEHAQRRRIGEHQPRGLRADRGLERGEIDVALAVGGDLAHDVAAHHRRRRIGAVRRIRHQDLACARCRRANRDRRGSSPRRRTRPARRPSARGSPPPCRSRPSASPAARTCRRENPARYRRARRDGARETAAASPACCRPAGCTSWCTNPAGRNACRSRNFSATARCSGAPRRVPRLPATAAGSRADTAAVSRSPPPGAAGACAGLRRPGRDSSNISMALLKFSSSLDMLIGRETVPGP